MGFIARNESFICQNCQKRVEPIVYGGSYRNHCPFCLCSLHVDGEVPGDRANKCRGVMEPIGVQTRRTGEYAIVHRCIKCGFERINRVAGDDDVELLASLSGQPIK